MKILVIGSGGREHALVWSLSRSPAVKKIYTSSRNAGILRQAVAVDANASDLASLADFAAREKIELTVVGPEQPLVDGLVDLFSARGLSVFGPTQAAARLEGSKVFAKEFMTRHRIPTARYRVVEEARTAMAVLHDGSFSYPVVIKADGLAAGKGVVVAETAAQAEATVNAFMLERKLGAAGTRLVIEECLFGREASYLVFTDGESYAAMPAARDYKRAQDDDQGPNTGGMGAISAPGLLDAATEQRIVREIVEPTLQGARAEGFPFSGVLYCGLMLTAEGPKVLEYNVRLGDPETQVILRRLESDLLELISAVTRGELKNVRPQWSADATACVVVAAAGYPGSYQTGQPITGLEAAEQLEEVVIFHAGTRFSADGSVQTSGGRVLNITARQATLKQAITRAYEAVAKISFAGMHYRKDIGKNLELLP
jgi:phosphoribosylamine--glycine ligase